MGQSDVEHLENRIKLDDMGNKYAQYIHKIFAIEWCVPEHMVKPYETQGEQWAIGENKLGVEIKYDEKSIKSPNLYIEVKEKSVPSKPTYSASGIYRVDNSWLFLIGNYDIYYVFEIDAIRRLESEGDWRRVKTPTSLGFLLPKTEAEKAAINFSVLKEKNKTEDEWEQLALDYSIQRQPWMDKF